MVDLPRRSSSCTVENGDPKHARSIRKDTSSSRGSMEASPIRKSPEVVTPSVIRDSVIRDQVVEVLSSVSSQGHPALVDTGESTTCLAIEVAESCPPSLPALRIAQGTKTILRTGASSLWTCICDGLQGKSPEMKAREMVAASAVISPGGTSETLQKLSISEGDFRGSVFEDAG
ncbi:hypothetical protein LIER_36680 [Lithospermum erythrorhizon]|uniref:Uncharacterized protein n=1 Tax=Lithospermum erythrorhizon TaxID=34254 RepID=A0AAV3P941_LITER